jgi:hypothetical protein
MRMSVKVLGGWLGLVLVAGGSLAGCALLQNAQLPTEVFEFHYQLVDYQPPTQPGQPQGGYPVNSKQLGACNPLAMRLEDIARAVQQIGGGLGFGYLADCADWYTVTNNAQALRDEPLVQFGVQELGPNAISIYGSRGLVQGTSSEPVGVLISITSGLTVGQPINTGFMEISYGGTGDVFRCEGGSQPWHANISNPVQDDFFEFTLTSIDSERAEGEFQCLARNQTDPSDHSLLIVMGGSFSLKNELD